MRSVAQNTEFLYDLISQIFSGDGQNNENLNVSVNINRNKTKLMINKGKYHGNKR